MGSGAKFVKAIPNPTPRSDFGTLTHTLPLSPLLWAVLHVSMFRLLFSLRASFPDIVTQRKTPHPNDAGSPNACQQGASWAVVMARHGRHSVGVTQLSKRSHQLNEPMQHVNHDLTPSLGRGASKHKTMAITGHGHSQLSVWRTQLGVLTRWGPWDQLERRFITPTRTLNMVDLSISAGGAAQLSSAPDQTRLPRNNRS